MAYKLHVEVYRTRTPRSESEGYEILGYTQREFSSLEDALKAVDVLAAVTGATSEEIVFEVAIFDGENKNITKSLRFPSNISL